MDKQEPWCTCTKGTDAPGYRLGKSAKKMHTFFSYEHQGMWQLRSKPPPRNPVKPKRITEH